MLVAIGRMLKRKDKDNTITLLWVIILIQSLILQIEIQN